MKQNLVKGIFTLAVSGLLMAGNSTSAAEEEFHGSVAGWRFYSKHYDEKSGDENTGVICSMSTETSGGDLAGVQWGASDDGARYIRFWHSVGDEALTKFLAFDDGEGFIPVKHFTDEEFQFYYIVSSDFGTAKTAQEFYSLFAASNKISTSGYYLTLPGTRAALSSATFNECMGYNFFESELATFGLSHLPSYEDRPGYASKPTEPVRPDEDEYKVWYVGDADEIRFRGDISSASMREVVSLIVKHEPSRLVIESSPGGYVHQATLAANVVSRFGLNTFVEDSCASACVILFAGGEMRSASVDARFGIHQFSGGSTASTQESYSRISDLFLTGGVDSRLLFEMMRIEADDMKYLNVLEASAYGLVN